MINPIKQKTASHIKMLAIEDPFSLVELYGCPRVLEIYSRKQGGQFQATALDRALTVISDAYDKQCDDSA